MKKLRKDIDCSSESEAGSLVDNKVSIHCKEGECVSYKHEIP